MTDQTILHFLETKKIAVLTTLLEDSTPHSATLHYSHTSDPLKLYFSTKNTSRKCQNLLNGQVGKSSLVIGFSEEEWITLQMEGTIQIVTNKNELDKISPLHYSRHPNSAKFKDDPATVFLAFTPNWWRYTDFNTRPSTVISSEG